MRAIRQFSFWLMAVLLLVTAANASDDVKVLPIRDEQQLYEFIAEFNNNGPANIQFGYLADVTGLNSVFSSTTTKDETTALFTVVITADAFQVVNHGASRITDRKGTCTIYLNNGPSDFSNPASFSQGTPIQVSTYRQTVLVNTVTNEFLSTNTHTITAVETFTLNGVSYRLGQLGKSYRSTYNGYSLVIQPPIVTGSFAALAIGMK
ncbi:MAG TPA: hypothetical protein VMG82_20330 [Candidatus Sulfotelmatobacter sp.]|nr:hypothetical protein [Candidatus Sulfotelmatobacter sp.]